MHVITSPRLLSELLFSARRSGSSVGLVPTMGALHRGHMRLIKESLKANDITVVSLFVNPLQFNKAEDLEKYPRPFEEDRVMLAEQGVDVLYAPSEKEMYPEKPLVNISFGDLGNAMEGKFRPGHFDGVGLVVSKLLNQINPDRAYFGLKDLQQFLLVKRLVRDLSMQVDIIGVPTVRAESGLALSSRNVRLSPEGLEKAAYIFQGLNLSEELIRKGIDFDETKSRVIAFYSRIEGLQIEYFEFVNPANLQYQEGKWSGQGLAVCVAAYVEGVRLIDNLYLRQD
ncbi:MAG: pantoate--beta-alanine ligase [Cyclobacteriaceae bacterium]